MKKQFLALNRRASVFLLLFISLFLHSLGAFAQSLKGNVYDKEGQPITGATILVKGTTNGTVTNLDGEYTLNSVGKDAVIVVSYVGMKTQEINVHGRSNLNITMQDENLTLNETVVIGYGSVKKADLTGAVSVVKPDEYMQKVNTSIGDMLQGAAAGVSVRSSGEIGSAPSIQIRGTANLTNNDPLYVIDGMPSSNDINFNTNDIESIQILKDASAAAIYGSRAANGVVIITTKKGKEGKTKFEFSTQLAAQYLPRLKFAHANEWKKVYDVAFDNAIAEGVEGITSRLDHWNNDTDWQDAFFKTGIRQNYDLSFSGGSKDASYRTSLNYLNDSGTTIGRRLERYTGRFNSTAKLGIFSIGETFSFGQTQLNNAEANVLRKMGGALADVVRMIPTIPIYDNGPDATKNGFGRGNLTHARALGYNPIACVHNGGHKSEVQFLRGSGYIETAIMPWLKYKLNLGVDMYTSTTNSWSNGYAAALNGSDSNSSASTGYNKFTTYLVENTLSANKKLGKHHIDGVLGTSYQYTKVLDGSGSQQNLISTSPTDFLTVVSAGTTDATAAGHIYEAALISYLGRVNYNYADKYLLTLTARIDGSSRFAKGYKWGAFPSVSMAWRISNEKFFHAKWIDDLKLRANWGNLGSQNVGYYDYQMYVNSYPQYLFNGDGGGITHGQSIQKLANHDLSWERMEQTNIGVDAMFLHNRLQLSAEYYISKTHDVLTSLEILMTTGNAGGNPFVNAASLQNKGFELTATWRDKINKNLSYQLSANISHSDNKLLSFGYGKTEQYTSWTTSRVGKPIGMFYLVKTDGIFQSPEEVQAHKTSTGKVIQPNAKPGDIRYVDANDDGAITPEDRQICGSPWPDLELGLNFSVSYKAWDLGIIGYGKFGGKAYNVTRWYTDGLQDCNALMAGYDYWTPQNTHSHNPRPLYGDERNSLDYSDRWLENDSFFRISSISLGYNWKPAFLSKWINNIQVSMTAQNLITFTSYKSYDPDFQPTSLFEPGVDYCSYPSPKSIIFSLNVKF